MMRGEESIDKKENTLVLGVVASSSDQRYMGQLYRGRIELDGVSFCKSDKAAWLVNTVAPPHFPTHSQPSLVNNSLLDHGCVVQNTGPCPHLAHTTISTGELGIPSALP